ncbi:hypothetical protein AXG93_673s1350 [Marchantia polymorpha subsp. ruderalis]|uniref:Dynein assembly factor 1, axonemal n=1 Tax=Marchantia polymorpha subsp. ruderalis TaxID=1480154 RepID=A0A176WID3_MARPO|nr:hypothetical protein AXG93_673s1350 [Marchantia polymorpha subsp. ruderalis]
MVPITSTAVQQAKKISNRNKRGKDVARESRKSLWVQALVGRITSVLSTVQAPVGQTTSVLSTVQALVGRITSVLSTVQALFRQTTSVLSTVQALVGRITSVLSTGSSLDGRRPARQAGIDVAKGYNGGYVLPALAVALTLGRQRTVGRCVPLPQAAASRSLRFLRTCRRRWLDVYFLTDSSMERISGEVEAKLSEPVDLTSTVSVNTSTLNALCDLQNLEEYTGVKLLYLEENCLESMNGLQPLKQLQCLYLRKNFIKSIDHIDELQFLDTLDIRILDLSHNELKDGDGVLEIALSLPQLAVLYLSGNPCISRMPHYRKNIIAKLAKLSHLDDRPVFWDERLFAEAWLRGGQEAETAERDRVREIRVDEENKQYEAMRRIREQNMAERVHVAPPTLLQFSPSELGEKEPETCALSGDLPANEVGMSSDKVETKKEGLGCSSEMVDDEFSVEMEVDQPVPASSQFQQHTSPGDMKPLPCTCRVAEVEPNGSEQENRQKLASNPLFNDDARHSFSEEQKAWPTANPSMFSTELQSICLPEWVGSEIKTDSFSTVHDNKLFSEEALEDRCSDAQPDGSTTRPCWATTERGPDMEEPVPPTLQGRGRDSLASLAASELGTYTCQEPSSSMKEEDSLILSLQAMNNVRVDDR